jgi:hypothetical protein
MSRTDFAREALLASCHRALARSGFIRYEPSKLDWPLSAHFHAWIRLNIRDTDEGHEIEPLIGLHAVAIERLWTTLKTGPYRSFYRRDLVTIAEPLRQIAHLSDPILVPRGRRRREAISRLVALYRTAGLDWASRLAEYDALEQALRPRVESLGGNPERLALCLFMSGRIEEAQSFVATFLDRRRSYFAGFAEPFAEILGQWLPGQDGLALGL